MEKYILILDEGTRNVKAFVYDEEKGFLASVSEKLPLKHPKPGWVEQDPETIFKKSLKVLKKVLVKSKVEVSEVKGLAVTNQRLTTILWDKDKGLPVYNALTWMDTRTSQLSAEMKREYGEEMPEELQRIFNPSLSSMYIKWLIENVNDIKEKIKNGKIIFGTIDTYIIWRLTKGKIHATDFSNASSTGMFDYFELTWWEDLLEMFGIPSEILPEIRETNGGFGYVDKSFFGEPLEIISATGDQQSALFGEACFSKGDTKCTLGSGGFVDVNIGRKFKIPGHGLVPLVAWKINGKTFFMVEGYSYVAGEAVLWLKDNLKIIKEVDESEKLAFKAGSNKGVYFVPAFTGLSSPYWDSYARGLLIGLTREISRENIVRAVLESIVYRVKDIVEVMEKDLKLKIEKLRLDGGVSKNNFVAQFMADCLNLEVERTKVSEATSLGAAYLACLGAGIYNSLKEITERREVDKVFKPGIEEKKIETLYLNWKRAVERSREWLSKNE